MERLSESQTSRKNGLRSGALRMWKENQWALHGASLAEVYGACQSRTCVRVHVGGDGRWGGYVGGDGT